MPLTPAMLGSISIRIRVEAAMGIKRDPISKITNPERAAEERKWHSSCLASTRALIQPLVLKKEKKKRKKKRS
jgi:hypothetical protein